MKHILSYILFENSNIPEYWYHGTNSTFDEFDVKYQGANFETSTLGIYFTQHMYPPPYSSTAKEYAQDTTRNKGGVPIIYKCKLIMKNPLILDSNGWYSSVSYIDKNRNDIKRWLNNDNYDSILVYNHGEDNIEYKDYISVVFNPKQIQIIEKINI